ncbi:hypothetical protein Scep_009266 [Stephania cephalantha]|uniref:Uncharacterized protein n=1 Tax=Stephania cephalantha TaxID=152367 RepID=A0AAP0PG38_9MAGN
MARWRRGSRTAAVVRLEFGQVNESSARTTRTRETRTSSVGGIEFTDRQMGAAMAIELRKTNDWNSKHNGVVTRVISNTSGGVNADEVLIVVGGYSRK